MKSLKLKGAQNKKKVIGYLAFVFDYEIKNYQSVNKFIDTIIDNINCSNLIGYAGFHYRKHLKRTLQNYLFDRHFKGSFTPPSNKIVKSKITNIIRKTLEKSNKYLTSKAFTRIFVFPTFSEFVKNKANGVTGFTPWKYVFYIFLYPQTKNFEREIRLVIAHEYNHAIFFEYRRIRKNILESIIMEGLAINFSLKVVPGKSPKFATALSQKQCLKIWPKIKKLLKFGNPKLNEQLFHNEGGKYPHWTGYSLGYQIVKSFLGKHSKMSWSDIMKIKPKTILKESGWDN